MAGSQTLRGLGTSYFNLYSSVLISLQARCPELLVFSRSSLNLPSWNPLPYQSALEIYESSPTMSPSASCEREAQLPICGPHNLRRNSWSVTCRLSEIQSLGRHTQYRCPIYSGQARPFYQCHSRSLRYDARSSVAKTEVLYIPIMLVVAGAFEKRIVALCMSAICRLLITYFTRVRAENARRWS